MPKQIKQEELQEFWEWCGFTQNKQNYGRGSEYLWNYPDAQVGTLPSIDLNNLFKYAPDIIVGVCFRYYSGGCECELTYITEAGFDTEKSWVKNETDDEGKSRELSDQALYQALLAIQKARRKDK